MTSSPDLIQELRAARPAAPADLRARVRTISAEPSPTTRPRRFPIRRPLFVALPVAAALALASAGVLGLAHSGRGSSTALHDQAVEKTGSGSAQLAPPSAGQRVHGALDSTAPQSTGRAQQVSATLTVEVKDSNGVSRAAQDALDLTRSLGGYVVSSSVATGEQGSASIVVRIPVGRVQEAITGLSGLGRIVSQQVQISDLQATLDQLEKREATVRGQIARIRARLATESLDPETEATLRAKLQTLRSELVDLRTGISTTNAEARVATVQLSVVTPDASGTVVPATRIHRTVDGALNVLAWEGIVLLGILIVLAPLALVGLAAWLGRRLYRKHEAERLLAT
jgi:flagellar basal body-associated protein FliL